MAKKSNQTNVQHQELAQTMSQFQVLSARLLELNVVELEDRVRAELHENPALDEQVEQPSSELDIVEEGQEVDDVRADYRTEDDVPDYELNRPSSNRYLQIEEIPFSEATSFFEMLQSQLDERNLNEHQRELASYLIGSLDDDGLLRKELTTICDELMWHMDIFTTVDELTELLKVIQDFDPPGVGARNLQECLLLQIARRQRTAPQNELLKLERLIVTEHYKDFTNKQWKRIEQRIDATPEQFQQAIDEICRLNPRPGASMGETIDRNNQQIVPDFIIDTLDDEQIVISLNNRNIPSLYLNKEYMQLLEEEESKEQLAADKDSQEATSFLKQKISTAQAFIGALSLRHQTMMRTMETIVQLQRPFFLEGDFALLKPMTRMEIAKKLGMDVSTISRVCNGKYAQTNFGIFALKDFFVEAFDEKKDMSVIAIEQALQKIVDEEDKQNPFTDDELCEQLKQKGLNMARRTIAKYREQLGIPVARLRKEI